MKPQSVDDEEDGGIECVSDSNGDPDYDVKKLIDWNGDWIPPPETWSARHAFTNRHFGASIEKWINGHDASCLENLTDLLTSLDFLGEKVSHYMNGILSMGGLAVWGSAGYQTANPHTRH